MISAGDIVKACGIPQETHPSAFDQEQSRCLTNSTLRVLKDEIENFVDMTGWEIEKFLSKDIELLDRVCQKIAGENFGKAYAILQVALHKKKADDINGWATKPRDLRQKILQDLKEAVCGMYPDFRSASKKDKKEITISYLEQTFGNAVDGKAKVKIAEALAAQKEQPIPRAPAAPVVNPGINRFK